MTTATITGTVSSMAISDNATIAFTSNASIAGAVKRANGTGISGRTVTLVNGAGQIVATTTTAAGGAYSFTNVTPGSYRVEFESNGSYKAKARSSSGNSSGYTVSNITLGATTAVTNVDAVVIDPAGVVYSSSTRAPLSGAMVSLYYNGSKVNNTGWIPALAAPTIRRRGPMAPTRSC